MLIHSNSLDSDIYGAVINFLKASQSYFETVSKSLEILNVDGETAGYLIPLTFLDLEDARAIQLLATWRDENQSAYPSRFTVTTAGTATWLKKAVLENNDRVLFWVADKNFHKIGHLGLLREIDKDNELEIDNVVRGESAEPGLMSSAMRRLEQWAEEEFSKSELSLRVLMSNSRAISFYDRLGYSESSRVKLALETRGNESFLVPGEPAVDEFITMRKNLIETRVAEDKILTAGPSISSHENAFVADAVRYGWNSHHSDYLAEFESQFASYVGAKYAMATSSCTGALHLALLALGVGPGDEVIVPEITWVATASAVAYTGATPVFADVDEVTWTISIPSVEKLITKRTKVIIPVHLYGYAANIIELVALAKNYGIAVVEDAAPAIGTKLGETTVGSVGEFGCYSFQGAKMLVTGEGGMIVSNDPDLFAKAKKCQDHGRRPGTFWIEELGYKYKMSNIQGALGLGQLLRAENQILRKRRINQWYREDLADIAGIKFQEELANSRSICWMTSITLDPSLNISREKLMSDLAEVGIDSRPAFPAISQYPIWNTNNAPKPTAKIIGDHSINLPSGVKLSRTSISRITSTIRKSLSK